MLFEGDSYPFQISVDHTEVVHVVQALCNVDQLNIISVRLLWGQEITDKLSAVDVRIALNELVDVSIFHPPRN